MTTGRYRHKPIAAQVEGPLEAPRLVPHAVGERTYAEPGMFIATVDAMNDVIRGKEIRVMSAAELDFAYDPLEWEECSLCRCPRAHATCTHVIVVGDQVHVGRLAWERICDELALNRSKAKAHP